MMYLFMLIMMVCVVFSMYMFAVVGVGMYRRQHTSQQFWRCCLLHSLSQFLRAKITAKLHSKDNRNMYNIEQIIPTFTR